MDGDELVRSYLKALLSSRNVDLGEVVVGRGKAIPTQGGGKEKISYRVVPPEWFNLPSEEYPIVRGKEVMMECTFRNSKAQVFTARPYNGEAPLSKILNSRLRSIPERSMFYCALNAVMKEFGLLRGTIHCRGNTPIYCGRMLLQRILSEYGDVPTLLIGYQPAFADALARHLSKVYITDMDPEDIGKCVGGVYVQDHYMNEELIKNVDLVVVTGSSIVNSTFWNILNWSKSYGKELIVYGVSGAGVAEILRLKRHCPYTQ